VVARKPSACDQVSFDLLGRSAILVGLVLARSEFYMSTLNQRRYFTGSFLGSSDSTC
jgi:hypothetical protein